jgi:hypothetical protein
MPHRVATFFRKNSNNNSDLPQDLKRRPRRPSLSHSSPSSSGSSLLSEDKMPDSAYKRLSLSGLTHPAKNSSKSLNHQTATLNVAIESPPLVMYGPTATSTGALLSGQLTLHILEDSLAIESFKMRLALEVTRKKPFHSHCQDCAHQSTDLTTWAVLAGPTTLLKGEQKTDYAGLICANESCRRA